MFPCSPATYTSNLNSSLLSNYGIVSSVSKSRKSQEEENALDEAIAASVADGRNFALCVLQCIGSSMNAFKADLRRYSETSVDQRCSRDNFVELMRMYVLRFAQDPENDAALPDEFRRITRTSKGRDRPTWMLDPEWDKYRQDPADELRVRLNQLFSLMDHNERNSIFWEQASDYFADCAARGSIQPTPSPIYTYDADVPIDRGQRTVLDAKVIFDKRGDNPGLAFLTSDTPRIRSPPESVVEIFRPSNLRECESRHWMPQSSVSSFEFVPHLKSFVTSSADMQLRLYDAKLERSPPQLEVNPQESFSILSWSDLWQRLWVGGTSGKMQIWRLPTELTGGPRDRDDFQIVHTLHGLHKSAVTKIRFLPLDGSIVCCSMDPRLLLLEPHRGDSILELQGHRGAICDVAYQPDNHFLVSCGFDQAVFLWSLHGGRGGPGGHGAPNMSKPTVLLEDREQPHSRSIISVHCPEGTPQILSLDLSGMLKVWDVRTFRCVQSVDAAPGKRATRDKDLQGSVYVHAYRDLIFWTKKTVRRAAYTSKRSNVDEETAMDTLIGVQCAAIDGSLVSCTQSALLVWQPVSGIMSSHYDARSFAEGAEITAFAVDCTGRKVIIGYRGGTVVLCNVHNGKRFYRRQISASDSDIADVAYRSESKLAVAVDTTGSVYVFSDHFDGVSLCQLERQCGARHVLLAVAKRFLFVIRSRGIAPYFLRPDRGALPTTTDQLIDVSLRGQAHQEGARTTFMSDVAHVCLVETEYCGLIALESSWKFSVWRIDDEKGSSAKLALVAFFQPVTDLVSPAPELCLVAFASAEHTGTVPFIFFADDTGVVSCFSAEGILQAAKDSPRPLFVGSCRMTNRVRPTSMLIVPSCASIVVSSMERTMGIQPFNGFQVPLPRLHASPPKHLEWAANIHGVLGIDESLFLRGPITLRSGRQAQLSHDPCMSGRHIHVREFSRMTIRNRSASEFLIETESSTFHLTSSLATSNEPTSHGSTTTDHCERPRDPLRGRRTPMLSTAPVRVSELSSPHRDEFSALENDSRNNVLHPERRVLFTSRELRERRRLITEAGIQATRCRVSALPPDVSPLKVAIDKVLTDLRNRGSSVISTDVLSSSVIAREQAKQRNPLKDHLLQRLESGVKLEASTINDQSICKRHVTVLRRRLEQQTRERCGEARDLITECSTTFVCSVLRPGGGWAHRRSSIEPVSLPQPRHENNDATGLPASRLGSRASKRTLRSFAGSRAVTPSYGVGIHLGAVRNPPGF